MSVRWHTRRPLNPEFEQKPVVKLNAVLNKNEPLIGQVDPVFHAPLYQLADLMRRTGFELPISSKEIVSKLTSPVSGSMYTKYISTVSYNDLELDLPYVRPQTDDDRKLLKNLVSMDTSKGSRYYSGPDCQGRPDEMWDNHEYGVQINYVPYGGRDPSTNWGITRMIDLDSNTLIKEMYSCCGLKLDNPGCWYGEAINLLTGPTPYNFAPALMEVYDDELEHWVRTLRKKLITGADGESAGRGEGLRNAWRKARDVARGMQMESG